jgi:Tfp pilus assembly pilus retraction ATPase PilT
MHFEQLRCSTVRTLLSTRMRGLISRMTPEEKEKQKKVEKEIAKRTAAINEGLKENERRWQKLVESIKKGITTLDNIDPETASPELLPMLEKPEATLRHISDLRTNRNQPKRIERQTTFQPLAALPPLASLLTKPCRTKPC